VCTGTAITWRFWESRFRDQDPPDPALWRQQDRRTCNAGLGRDLGRDRAHCFDKFEYLCGTSGKAGNLKGQIQPGGNPFESARSREYPNPPMKMPYASTLFAEKRQRKLGLHPFPLPSANLSQSYVNPLGVRMGECSYCGFCERFACGNYSKASAQTTILPVLIKKPNFSRPAPNAKC
jgi:gluconate 2-dehydrogenase alpha chain